MDLQWEGFRNTSTFKPNVPMLMSAVLAARIVTHNHKDENRKQIRKRPKIGQRDSLT